MGRRLLLVAVHTELAKRLDQHDIHFSEMRARKKNIPVKRNERFRSASGMDEGRERVLALIVRPPVSDTSLLGSSLYAALLLSRDRHRGKGKVAVGLFRLERRASQAIYRGTDKPQVASGSQGWSDPLAAWNGRERQRIIIKY